MRLSSKFDPEQEKHLEVSGYFQINAVVHLFGKANQFLLAHASDNEGNGRYGLL